MSKSIIINGADFSQNGFQVPIEVNMSIIYGPNADRDYYFDCGAYFTANNTNVGQIEESYLLDYDFTGYDRLAVGTFELYSNYNYSLDFYRNYGNGCGIYLFVDQNMTIVSEVAMSEEWGLQREQIELTSIPANAKYCRICFAKEYPYSITANKKSN